MVGADGALSQAGNILRLLVPQVFLALTVIMTFVVLPLPGFETIRPFFVLMPVYYWSVYRPTIVPPVLCFAAGILLDSLQGMPIGLNAVTLVAARWLVTDQRKFLMGQPYMVIWAIFALVCGVYALLQWGLSGLASQMTWGPLVPVAASAVATVLLFPFITMILVLIHRFLPVATRAHH